MFCFRCSFLLLLIAALFILLLFVPTSATAHVKWFSPYTLADAPMALDQLLRAPVFWLFLGGITLVMFLATYIEKWSLADRLINGLDALTIGMRHRLDDMMRIGTGAFLLALWVLGGVILTPELKTDQGWISWLQFGMALSLFWRMTIPLTSIGIVFLWCLGVSEYGLFHLLDYPIFLGIAIYLMIFVWPEGRFFRYRFDVLRFGAAVTLMWASIEKFAYPEWSFPILDAMPFLTLGLSKDNFMILAGLGEFALAFALIWTPLVCRLSAVFLCVLFTAAIVPFGKIDAIGHLMIILILISVFVNDRHVSFRFRPALMLIPLKYASLVGFTTAFYGLQALFYSHPKADTDVSHVEMAVPSTQSERDMVQNMAHDMATLQLSTAHPDPVLKAWSARGDDGIWRLFLKVENFILSDPAEPAVGTLPTGHVHIFRGEQKLAAAYTPVVALDILEPGLHRLSLVLFSNDHRMLLGRKGAISQEIVIDIPSP